ncbi:hypothetical protein EMCG_09333 [[Emmonsia] crescens]|uniref:Uncharacterized protein n=1 Tax=[Emmonsia] crescens TaxID=73230 RepID=A0A0G2I307_9EURO|nr:hypothetical protein EMCG_09333 [Emmonsia crescens UAMH 3008]
MNRKRDIQHQDARDRAQKIQEIQAEAREALKKAQKYQTVYYNSKRTAKSFREGDRVWLSLENISAQCFFHVSLLREHKELSGENPTAHHFVREALESEREYHVKEIVDAEKRGRET